MHPDFKDVDAVAPAMGNHLIDVTGHEFQGMPFTRSWIYGVYGGRVIFYEEMVALDYLQSRPNACEAIKSRGRGRESATTRRSAVSAQGPSLVVSMEQCVYREAGNVARARAAVSAAPRLFSAHHH